MFGGFSTLIFFGRVLIYFFGCLAGEGILLVGVLGFAFLLTPTYGG